MSITDMMLNKIDVDIQNL